MILLKKSQKFGSLPRANTLDIVYIFCTPRFTGGGGGDSNRIHTTGAASGAGSTFPGGVFEFTVGI